ncbi:MAG: M20/M25/M40 family metallo-hydrolase [Synergistaceae bacterium]|nr:M20/M25/M40 family metallo-hydrolase [Synergistaceae bacterium]
MHPAIINDFLELVQIDAASLNERAVADAVTAKLKEIGCSVWEDPESARALGGNAGNLYAVLDGGLEGSILFSSHLDRVANGIGIKPVFSDGRIVSRGTILAADDLSGVAAIIDGLRRVKESGEKHSRVEVVFTVCEEKGILGSLHLDYSRIKSKTAYVLDSPGRIGRVINSAPSRVSIAIEIKGRAAHAGNAPEQGINAVAVGARILTSIKEGRIDGESTANFSTFEASGPTNIVTAKAVIVGEARSRNHAKLENYLAELGAVCKKVASETGAEITVDVTHNYRSFLTPESSETIGLIGRVFDDMGIQMKVEPGGGGMDANRLSANGIECVGVATGYAKNHTPDEFLVAEDLVRSGELVQRLISAYSSSIKS